MPVDDPAQPKPPSLVDTIYEGLWNDIVYGVLEAGQSLDEVALVKRFDSSRTPLREAIARLSGDGLVVQHRNRGAYVSEIRVNELSAFLEALHLMQRVVTRLAAQRWTEPDMVALRAAAMTYETQAQANDPRIALELDQAFHFCIASIARNSYIENLYRKLLVWQMRIFLLHARGKNWNDPELATQLEQSVSEHQALLNAIENRALDAAEKLGGEHIRLIRKQVLAFTSSEIVVSIRSVTEAAASPSPLEKA